MHLDRRGHAYETFREGGRVCRRFVASGEFAGLLVKCFEGGDLLRRLDLVAQREAIEAARAGESELQTFCAASNALFRASMKAGGYHRPKRGQWRKARDPMPKPLLPHIPQDAAQEPSATLLERAGKGDKDAAREAIERFKGTEEEGRALEILASFSEVAREGVIGAITNDELRRAAFRRQLEVTRDELAGGNPSALELHLAERVALCALSVARLESVFEENVTNSPKIWELVGRMLDGAHRRHLDAARALASVRKLRLPNVQVNIAQKQVNMGTLGGDST